MEENKRKTLAVTHKSSTEWFFSLSIKKGTQKNRQANSGCVAPLATCHKSAAIQHLT